MSPAARRFRACWFLAVTRTTGGGIGGRTRHGPSQLAQAPVATRRNRNCSAIIKPDCSRVRMDSLTARPHEELLRDRRASLARIVLHVDGVNKRWFYPGPFRKLIYVSLRHANIATGHSPSVREFCRMLAHIAPTAIKFGRHFFKPKMLSSGHRKNRAYFGQYPDGFLHGYLSVVLHITDV